MHISFHRYSIIFCFNYPPQNPKTPRIQISIKELKRDAKFIIYIQFSFLHSNDTFGNLFKQLLHSFTRLRGGFRLYHSVFLTQAFCHSFSNFSLWFFDIAFVASKSHHELISIVVIHHLIDPEMHTCEAFIICDIITYNCSSCVSVVKRDHRSESLWTASVPNMKLNLSAIRERNCLL